MIDRKHALLSVSLAALLFQLIQVLVVVQACNPVTGDFSDCSGSVFNAISVNGITDNNAPSLRNTE
eukprot:CAMPEP_0182447680 /NCGR_PEP_ID=MMETSP1172-20130603/18655_1 /TAXON_ID=708627 /ORGANISM="Timspurckia oligopyrenoides, Strain CCMP3278" /LENGTH=65 /DNA_ID=CAMNT_0024644205 /DNA_START=33 /DNA_END=227 /DNA_ORIENTATION=+